MPESRTGAGPASGTTPGFATGDATAVANTPGSTKGLKVLVVDDDRNIVQTLQLGLESLGCCAVKARSAEEALKVMEGDSFDLLLSDFRMAGLTGVDLVRKAKQLYPQMPAVVMTAYASYENAVAAIKEGAFDYLPKPFSVAQLEHLLGKVKTVLDLRRENAMLRGLNSHPEYFYGYTSPAAQRLADIAKKVAPTDATVLIIGESGTGKSEFARLLHARSARANKPLVEVNCADLTHTLVESELFGHVKGAFTGAISDKLGKLEAGSGGTVFLDEVGELSPGGQAKLLRFLQERVIERVGSTKPITVDARVIAATNKKLEESVAKGEFREDLYYRLNVFECVMVALRHRQEDLPVLIKQMIKEKAARLGQVVPELPTVVLDKMLVYSWPGNIRELRNVVERLLILAQGRAADVLDLPDSVRLYEQSAGTSSDGPLCSLKDLECEHIKRVLGQIKTQEKAAQILGITTVTLWRKRKEYGL